MNLAKKQLEEVFSTSLAKIENAEMAAKIGTPQDVTLPSPELPVGTTHPLTQIPKLSLFFNALDLQLLKVQKLKRVVLF